LTVNTKAPKHPKLCKIFIEPPVVAFRKHKSLNDLMVRAVISTYKIDIGQCKECRNRRYVICKNIAETQKFHSKVMGEE
jgi:hypothetical protein